MHGYQLFNSEILSKISKKNVQKINKTKQVIIYKHNFSLLYFRPYLRNTCYFPRQLDKAQENPFQQELPHPPGISYASFVRIPNLHCHGHINDLAHKLAKNAY